MNIIALAQSFRVEYGAARKAQASRFRFLSLRPPKDLVPRRAIKVSLERAEGRQIVAIARGVKRWLNQNYSLAAKGLPRC